MSVGSATSWTFQAATGLLLVPQTRLAEAMATGERQRLFVPGIENTVAQLTLGRHGRVFVLSPSYLYSSKFLVRYVGL